MSPPPEESEEWKGETEKPISLPFEEITLDIAMRWLDEVRPQAALALLRGPAVLPVASAAFAGFRQNAAGYAHPLVRKRLGQMLVRDAEFREQFQGLLPPTSLPQPLSPPGKGEQEETEPTPNPSLKGRETALLEQLDEERRLRKRDRSEARAGLDQSRESAAAARRELDAALGELRRTTEEREALRKALELASERISRLDRRTSRLRIERDVLMKASTPHPNPFLGKEREPGSIPAATPSSELPAPTVDKGLPAFELAVRQLQAKGDNALALAVVEQVLRTEPRNMAALDIASAAHLDLGRRDQSAAAGRELIFAALDRGAVRQATETLVNLLIALPDTPVLESVARPFVAGLRVASAGDLSDMSKLFGKLRGANPAAYAGISRIIEEYASPAIAAGLFPPEQPLGPSDRLPFDLPESITAAALLAAIDEGDTSTVNLVRGSMTRLLAAGGSQYDRVIAAISAAGGDETYLRPLTKQPRGPVVVDASNVAWHDEGPGIGERPRLKHILRIRATLRMRGFFPVVLITDAPLPYTIDDREGLRKLIARREVTIVDTGTDADEVLIREARRLGAPIVTNDYMADWDPGGEIEKIRYAMSTGGTVYLLS